MTPRWYHCGITVAVVGGSLATMAMTLRLSVSQGRALALLAQSMGTSKHEAVVRSIVAQATRMLEDAQVADLARELVPGYSVMDRRLRAAEGGVGDDGFS